MKKTLFRQLIAYMLIFGIALGVLSYLVIEFYFDDYYYARQERSLINSADYLIRTYDLGGLAALLDILDEYSAEKGLSVHFLDAGTQTVYGSFLQGAGRQNISALFNASNIGKIFISSTTGQGSPNNWISYLAAADDGGLLLTRISYSSMDAVVSIVRTFFLLFGISLAVLFILFAFFFSRSMSRPLKELNSIAAQMGHLDFSLKYTGNREDEIGELGTTLNMLTAKLENTINQLKSELTKEKSLEKMRTQFTAQVSHELQTPLSVIKGYSEALIDNLYSKGETAAVYEILLNEAQKISDMVDDLLDLSQMESGVFIARKESFSIYSLMKKIFDRYSLLSREENFTIEFKSDYPEGKMFFGDPLRIEQAVRNILSNAIKHTKSGGRIMMELVLKDGTTSITVSNQGEKIADDDMNHIFDSYYQGKNHRGGTGLGLSITRHIINLHGGTVSASNTNDGVELEISLP
ncbi:MAG: HAMP domain-containing histidine kinase [Clostridia bacterium]|nr:HAMP domain-containing histidine kinase [Clostridia bacterium]